MNKDNIIKSSLAALCSFITIGVLTVLTYKTELGIFLIASFGSSMVVLYGYLKVHLLNQKIFFCHLLTSSWYDMLIYSSNT